LNSKDDIPNITTEEFNRIIAGKINVSILEKIPDVDLNATDLRQLKPLTHEMITSDKKSNFWKAVKATLAGETTVGIIGREVKNVVKRVIPFGEVIDATADRVGNLFKSKRTKNTIMQNTEKKPWYRSTTMNSILSFIALLAVQVFDIDIVAADLQAVVVAIGMAVSAVVALYGRITATQEIGKSI